MKLYLYDEFTKEYIETIEAYLDPEETRIQGKEVCMYPANSTDIEPPTTIENQVCIFEVDNWVVKADFRGQYQCNEDLEVSLVDCVGELQEGFILITEEQAKKIEEDKLFYIVQDGELIENPNYEAEQEQKERERIGNLFLTGADVERGIYQAKGMDFEDILAFVMANPPVGLDVKALRIELKANHFYRGNTYVNAVGALLGFTSEQLDKFFEFNDFTYLIPEPDVDNSEGTNEENSVIDEVTEGDDVNNSEE